MKFAVIAIGDEILAGQVTDTNSGMMARKAEPHGFELGETCVVADDAACIEQALQRLTSQYSVVITTGGLGPTKDDITKLVLCQMLNCGMRRDQDALDNARSIMERRGRPMNALTETQADVPEKCRAYRNSCGTAPIMHLELNGCQTFCLPGVPFEASAAMDDTVLPVLESMYDMGVTLRRRTLVLESSISESSLAERLAGIEASMPANLHLAYLPGNGVIRLRIDGHSDDAATLDRDMSVHVAELSALVKPWLLATDDLTPAQILIETLRRQHMTVATAESCTGGAIASAITAIAGCSDVMVGGVVSYANSVKTGVLGVPEAYIERDGAVSRSVVEAMSQGVIRLTGASVGIATSGIAGPSGGSQEKPVGTVWISVSTATGTHSQLLHLPGNRERVIQRATAMALINAIRHLQDIP